MLTEEVLTDAGRATIDGMVRELNALHAECDALRARLVADELETLDFLWHEYVQADPVTLTEDAKELAERVRQKVRELAGVQQLEARLAEVEAQAAAMRGALEDVDAVHRSAMGQPNERGDNLTPVELFRRVRAALSSSTGRETADRLRLLEELAEAATAFTERCRIVECEARNVQEVCGDWDACPVERLEDAVKALKGGEADAGTEA